MDIETIEMAERKAKFILKNSTPAMANALRRTLLSDIPKMAIDDVEFSLGMMSDESEKEYECTTPLFDEIIAHRLGMIPVPTDLELFTFQDQCSCGGEGCPNCSIMYSLNKIGPCTVYSGDLMPLGNPDLKVKDEFIPIVELTDGQAVLIYATAVMGTAKTHVKWQVCNGVGYSYMPVITLNEDMADDEDALKVVQASKSDVFAIEDGKIVVKNPIHCSDYIDTIDKLVDLGAIEVHGDDTQFIFKFETDGSLTAQQALDKAVEILAEEARDFKSQIEAL